MRSKQRTVNETLYKPLIPLLNFAGMKEAARGSAGAALLLSKETLSGAYSELRARIDQIVA